MTIQVSRISAPFASTFSPEYTQVKFHVAKIPERSYASNSIESKSVKPEHLTFYGFQQTITPIPYIDKYVNVDVIENAIKENTKITQILKENGITPTVSQLNIGAHTKRHLFTTYLYAMEIAKSINLDPESSKCLAQASLLHDIGKALIPEEIIQKSGKLTPEERKIVNLHSELSAEILKTTDVSPRVIEIVGMHHSHADDKKHDTVSQILSIADVYSALKEERPYKKAMPDEKAFGIMETMPALSQPLVRNLRLSRHNSGKSFSALI